MRDYAYVVREDSNQPGITYSLAITVCIVYANERISIFSKYSDN